MKNDMHHQWAANYQEKTFVCSYCTKRIISLNDISASEDCSKHPRKIEIEQELIKETKKKLMEKTKLEFMAELKLLCLKHGVSLTPHQENVMLVYYAEKDRKKLAVAIDYDLEYICNKIEENTL